MSYYAPLSVISRRWQVDRATARTAIQRAGIPPCEIFGSPRYSWPAILEVVEGWPASVVGQINLDDQLETAETLADRLGVTPQTIRNYGRAGRLHRIEITPRAIRYGLPHLAKTGSEAKTDDTRQK